MSGIIKVAWVAAAYLFLLAPMVSGVATLATTAATAKPAARVKLRNF